MSWRACRHLRRLEISRQLRPTQALRNETGAVLPRGCVSVARARREVMQFRARSHAIPGSSAHPPARPLAYIRVGEFPSRSTARDVHDSNYISSNYNQRRAALSVTRAFSVLQNGPWRFIDHTRSFLCMPFCRYPPAHTLCPVCYFFGQN